MGSWIKDDAKNNMVGQDVRTIVDYTTWGERKKEDVASIKKKKKKKTKMAKMGKVTKFWARAPYLKRYSK